MKAFSLSAGTVHRVLVDPASGSVDGRYCPTREAVPKPFFGPTHKDGRTDVGPQYHRVEAVYGQYAYIGPVRHTAHLQALNKDAPPVYGDWSDHGDNMYYETYQHDIVSQSEAQRELSGINHAYVTSFITKGDPNAVLA
ncbi:hypothetical protein LTR93_011174 [Exophiala xenobiotica]|nr:hypothetical protein LTR93_011174 [Exophiala xenobiotica]